MSLRLKLIFLFLAVALIPLFFVSGLTFHTYKTSLETTRLLNLQDIAVYKADKIGSYFNRLKDSIKTSQSFYNIKKNLPILDKYSEESNHPEFIAAKQMLDEQLQHIQSVLGLLNIMLVNPEGKVVYSSDSGYYSKDFLNPLPDPIRHAFEEGKTKIYLSDIFSGSRDNNKPSLLITAPVVNMDGEIAGVIVFEVDTAAVNEIIQDVTGLGQTGEVLIGRKVENQVVFLTPLKFDAQAALQRKVEIGQEIGGPVQQAVQGKTGAGISIDYRGKKVIAAWRYIPALDWGMVAKIDIQEAFFEATRLRNLAIIALAIVIAMSSITAYFIARSISNPIKKLAKGAEIIGGGNLDYKIGTNLNDEIGQLSRSFDKMVCDLKQTTASRDELNREIAERGKIEASLRESEERFRLAIEAAPIPIIMHAEDGEVLQISRTWTEQTGYSINDIRSFDEWTSHAVYGDGADAVRDYLRSIFSSNSSSSRVEFALLTKTGQMRYWSFSASIPGQLTDGRHFVVGMALDITERKQAEEALRESQKRFSTVFHTSPAGIFVTRLADGMFFEANNAYLQIIGYSDQEILGHTLQELNVWVNREDRDEIVSVLRQQGHIHNWETKFRRKNGQIADIFFSAVVFEQAGESCILGTLMDVTERKHLELLLQRSLKEHQTILDSVPAMIFYKDRENHFVRTNRAFEEVMGLPRNELEGKSSFDLYPSKQAQACWDDDKEVMASGKPKRGILESMHTADGIRLVQTDKIPYFDESGNVIGVIGFTTDITERRKAEEELHESTEELNRFNRAAIGRELRLIELKKEVNSLCSLAGRPPQYPLNFEKENSHE